MFFFSVWYLPRTIGSLGYLVKFLAASVNNLFDSMQDLSNHFLFDLTFFLFFFVFLSLKHLLAKIFILLVKVSVAKSILS